MLHLGVSTVGRRLCDDVNFSWRSTEHFKLIIDRFLLFMPAEFFRSSIVRLQSIVSAWIRLCFISTIKKVEATYAWTVSNFRFQGENDGWWCNFSRKKLALHVFGLLLFRPLAFDVWGAAVNQSTYFPVIFCLVYSAFCPCSSTRSIYKKLISFCWIVLLRLPILRWFNGRKSRNVWNGC